MAYRAEGWIASELMKFAMNGLLYRGSKPVMWSVVEQTALAEAEVEYHDYESDTIFAKFPVRGVERKAYEARGSSDGSADEFVDCYLDDDALDDPWQPRNLVFIEAQAYGHLRGDVSAGGQLAAKKASISSLPKTSFQKCAEGCQNP